MLTDIMIYVATKAFVMATWRYAGGAAENVRIMPAGRRVEVPTAFAACRDPRSPSPPRAWVDLRDFAWGGATEGGRFAAVEEPDLFVDDLRALARDGR